MARLIRQADGKMLDLPGRLSLEKVSGAIGSRVTLRVVRIPSAKPGEALRGPHVHHGYEECIYVLAGEGFVSCESGELTVKPGDVVLIPAEEKHVTRNSGNESLVLLCFFPVSDVTGTTENFVGF